MRELFALCQTKAKFWRDFPSGSHNDTVAEPRYFEYIADFLREKVIGVEELS